MVNMVKDSADYYSALLARQNVKTDVEQAIRFEMGSVELNPYPANEWVASNRGPLTRMIDHSGFPYALSRGELKW